VEPLCGGVDGAELEKVEQSTPKQALREHLPYKLYEKR
jgi:hypothetical protein